MNCPDLTWSCVRCLRAETIILRNHSDAALYAQRVSAKVDTDTFVILHKVNTITQMVKLPTSTDDVSQSKKWAADVGDDEPLTQDDTIP